MSLIKKDQLKYQIGFMKKYRLKNQISFMKKDWFK